ncbi:hypothetical protein SAMN05216207_1008166 [Pseudonocardia ammonioxydans]|uniref:ARB-07466-like C-terminal domain-containing protein n=1 Tax=Pseudonocardia ammonioxydans TaxID=260086 RepID=A0A1I4WK06_PSUAM|nr:hypothetical protein [Pseudonocardia ammonioxydans]SFN13540.1 hypothetical protein SAMN05216207_1008166 [Pseudonocardia ammonioxydans]
MPRHRHRRVQAEPRPGLRHVATAAAVAGGTLAVVTPVTGLEFGPTEAELRLASSDLTSPGVAGVTDGTGSRTDGPDTDDREGSATDPEHPGIDAPGTDDAGRPGLAAALGSAFGSAFAEAPGPGGTAAAPRTEPVLGAGIVRDAGLLDATADAGRAAAAEAERLAREAAERAACDLDLDGLGPVKDWVSDAAEFLGCAYGQPELIGVAQRGNVSDHPTGHALDLMVRGSDGDRIAECALANAEELGVEYVIWEQRMNHGSGWTEMSDRGGDTANHYDHVHISFEKSAGSGSPSLERCSDGS